MKLLSTRLNLRMRIALLLGGLLLFILTGFGLFLYFRLSAELHQALDARLQTSVERWLTLVEQVGGRVYFDRADFSLPLTGEPEDVVRLVSPAGQLLDAHGDDQIPLLPTMLQSGYLTFDYRHTETGEDATGETEATGEVAGEIEAKGILDETDSLRLLSVPVTVGDAVIAYLQVAYDLEEVNLALSKLRLLLLTTAPMLALLAALAGYWLAGQALAPIEAIRAQAAAIDARGLNRRLEMKLPDDEVGRLAHTFNAMLARLDASFLRQQRFAADASHELRTPLAILRGEVEVTLAQPRPPAEYVATLRSIGGETERMVRLVNELLLLARSDSADLALEWESLDLAELLAILVEQMQNEAATAQVALTAELPMALPVWGDRDRLLQLFINLIENGLIHAPGSRLVIHGRSVGQTVTIAVTDTGPGIPAHHLPFLFERFYRVDPGRSRARGGSGLGLAIAQEIVHAHQGAIRIESEIGRGTTVIVTLPRHDAQHDAGDAPG